MRSEHRSYSPITSAHLFAEPTKRCRTRPQPGHFHLFVGNSRRLTLVDDHDQSTSSEVRLKDRGCPLVAREHQIPRRREDERCITDQGRADDHRRRVLDGDVIVGRPTTRCEDYQGTMPRKPYLFNRRDVLLRRAYRHRTTSGCMHHLVMRPQAGGTTCTRTRGEPFFSRAVPGDWLALPLAPSWPCTWSARTPPFHRQSEPGTTAVRLLQLPDR